MTRSVSIASVQARVYRVPVREPVVNMIGTMYSRPMLLVRVEDTEGGVGWGEVWCNFPTVGAEHRARLIDSVFAPLLEGRDLATPAAHFRRLSEQTWRLAVQSGEPGTVAQCIAGLDQALTDLAARRAGQPLWRFLGGEQPRIKVYASALGPDGAAGPARECWERGFRDFKLKVGFGAQRDRRNLAELRAAVPDAAGIMVDANQAWTAEAAGPAIDALAEFRLTWMEEPIFADRPLDEWRALARRSPVPLAGGENVRGERDFAALVDSATVAFVQPDIGKWGGCTGGLAIGRAALAAGQAFCPHWLGGGVGLLASMHVLAAVGGPGYAEVDANPNPLRERMPLPPVADGHCLLAQAPGLGQDPEREFLPALEEYRVI